jgi:hypothetical protein
VETKRKIRDDVEGISGELTRLSRSVDSLKRELEATVQVESDRKWEEVPDEIWALRTQRIASIIEAKAWLWQHRHLESLLPPALRIKWEDEELEDGIKL